MPAISHRIIVGASGADLNDTLSIINEKIEEQIQALFQPAGAPIITITAVNDQAVYGVFQVLDTSVDGWKPDSTIAPAKEIVPVKEVVSTFDPAQKGNHAVLSEGNLVLSVDVPSANSGAALTSGGKTSGMWYADFIVEAIGINTQFGVVNSKGLADLDSGEAVGNTIHGWAYASGLMNGKLHDGKNAAFGERCAAGDCIGVALDVHNKRIYISRNNTWMNGGVPTSGSVGTGSMYKLPENHDTYYHIVANAWFDGKIRKNSPAKFAPPTGYTEL